MNFFSHDVVQQCCPVTVEKNALREKKEWFVEGVD
jgi:hypothetical protein